MCQKPMGWARACLSLTFAAAIPLLLGGCAVQEVRQVAIEGPVAAPSSPLALEIDSQGGDIHIIVDERLTEPTVKARVHAGWHRLREGQVEMIRSAQATAQVVNGDQGRVLQVTTQAPLDTEEDLDIDLTIHMPRCDGLTLRNTHGFIEIVNVGCAIQIDHGVGGGNGGDLEIRTEQDITEPISITNTDGNVFFWTGPNTTGLLDLRSMDGRATAQVRSGSVSDVTPNDSHWTGRLNDGENEFTIRTGQGRIRLIVTDKPASYIPYRW